jgi:diacylglycerol O-acyltransferase
LSKRSGRNRLFNLPISNVPGPRERGSFSGAPVSEIYSAGPLPPGCGINITVWSYVDQLNVSVIADDRTLDDTHEVTDAMFHAFSEIRSASGLSDELSEVPTAMPRASAN